MKKRYPISRIIVLVILFIVAYGIGLLPSYYFNKYITIPFFSVGFPYEIIGVLSIILNIGVFLLSEILSTTFFVIIFKIRTKEGEYISSMAEKEYLKSVLYHTLVYPILRITDFLFISHLKILMYKLLGAKIGKNVTIIGNCGDPHLLEIGDNSLIGAGALLTPHTGGPKKLIIKKINIGKNCLVGINSVVLGGVKMGDNSKVGALSLVLKDTKIPKNELWGGIPAKRIKKLT
jgi:acetyltransferase-like isoleucine patch superfamily enzyme